MSQNYHLIRVRMPDSFIEEGEVGKASKMSINLVNISQNGKPPEGDILVLISSFLPSTGEQGPEQKVLQLNSQAEGQNSLRQTIMCNYNNKSNEKLVKETV